MNEIEFFADKEAHLAPMANDPDAQQEIQEIVAEFSITELDELNIISAGS